MIGSGTESVLLCDVRGRRCAIPLEDVVETMRPLPIEPVAAAPAFVLGVAIVRGAPVVVVDVGRLLEAGAGQPGRFVTVRTGLRVVALAVDGVIGVGALPARSALPPLLDAAGDAMAAIGAVDGELLLVLRGARLVPAAVLDAIVAGAA